MTADIRCSVGFVNQVKATRRCYISTADNRQKENCRVCRLARMCDTIGYNIMAKHLRGGGSFAFREENLYSQKLSQYNACRLVLSINRP